MATIESALLAAVITTATASGTATAEALSAHSADIDTVSGATYTSDSYKASL